MKVDRTLFDGQIGWVAKVVVGFSLSFLLSSLSLTFDMILIDTVSRQYYCCLFNCWWIGSEDDWKRWRRDRYNAY